MKKIESIGREVELKATDFEIGKLSDKFGLMVFNKFEQRTYGKGTPSEYTCFLLTVTSVELKDNIEIRLTYNTENKVMLEKLGMFDAVDFENCLISHRANAVGTFATIIQTIFANKMTVLNKNALQMAVGANHQQPQPNK